MNNKTPEELYAYFLDMINATEQVWMLDSDDGYVVIQIPEGSFLPLWHTEEAAVAFAEEGQKPISMPVGNFLIMCEQLYDEILGFGVSPSKEGLTLVPAAALLNDLEEKLGIAE